MKINIIFIFLYLGIGVYIKKSFFELLILTIFFIINIYFWSLLFSFVKGIIIKGTIIDSIYGYTNMNRGQKNRYYIKYIYLSKEYKKRLSYSTSSNYKNGDQIEILINNSNQIIISDHLKYFIFLNVLFLSIIILFLFI